MVSSALIFTAFAAGANAEASNWNWNRMTQSNQVSGKEAGTFGHFDSNYMMALVGTNGQDDPVLHAKHSMPSVKLSSMEKVTAMTAVNTRASIRGQLVSLLKSQVRIESMYGTKKEKLYLSASSIYNFIANLLHSACSIALSNDGLWKEQMQCFSAYRQLLEIYSMWNGVRDVAFALEHGMAVTEGTLAVCGPNVAYQEHFVSQNPGSGRLQNQYLVSATMRACFDNLQVRIESLRRWLSTLLVSMDSQQDRAQSCLFRVITVLTCLSSGNQENVLDLAIKDEHKQHVVYSLANFASKAMSSDAVAEGSAANADEADVEDNGAEDVQGGANENDASFIELSSASEPTLREVHPLN